MVFWKKGRGYDHDEHMSVNARIAHDSGEKPISEWEKMSKKNLIDFIVDEEGYNEEEAKKIADFVKGNKKDHILDSILKYTCSHHVGEGALLREVEFFGLNDDSLKGIANPDWREELKKAHIAKAQKLLDSGDLEAKKMDDGWVEIHAKGDLFKDFHIVKIEGKKIIAVYEEDQFCY